jgi:hypothetical protein
MSRFTQLKEQTDQFFERHWSSRIQQSPPSLSERWHFQGGIPNQEEGGCYALLNEDDEILYIGVGAGKGQDRYPGAGLGSRPQRIWRKHPETPRTPEGISLYAPTENWKSTAAVVTIGFHSEYSYLAYALEAYLIKELGPPLNHKGKAT